MELVRYLRTFNLKPVDIVFHAAVESCKYRALERTLVNQDRRYVLCYAEETLNNI